jgi:hypothetical protein
MTAVILIPAAFGAAVIITSDLVGPLFPDSSTTAQMLEFKTIVILGGLVGVGLAVYSLISLWRRFSA